MKRQLPRKQSTKERKIQLLGGFANVLATPDTPQGKTPSSFAMHDDDKLKQMDARSRENDYGHSFRS